MYNCRRHVIIELSNKTNAVIGGKNMGINFIFTEDQQEAVCRHYGYERNELDEYQVCELLDRLIDETTANN